MNKRYLWVLIPFALLLFACEPGAQRTLDTEATTRYGIEELMRSVTYRGLSFSADGKTLVTSSDAKGSANLVAFPVDGGEPLWLTDSGDTQRLIGYFPHDDRLLFAADKDGDEVFHIYLRESDGSIKDLTPGEGNIGRFHGFAQDGKSLYLDDSSRKDGAFDIYELSTETYERELIFRNDEYYYIGPVSPDRSWLALMKVTDNRSAHIVLHDVESGENSAITVVDSHVYSVPRAFSPDGNYLYYTTDKWHEFEYLVRYDLESGAHEEVLKFDWDIQGFFTDASLATLTFADDGTRFAIVVNRDARKAVEVYDTKSLQKVGGSDMPGTSVASYALSRDGSTLGIIVTNGQIPGDIYVKDIGGGPARRLAASLSEQVESDHLVAGELVSFESWDGLTVPGILYKPHGATPESKAPAMVWVHGGPGQEERIGYRPLFAYLVNHGFVVFGVNNRGTSGYGKRFFHLDDQAHGKGDLKDVVAAKRFLIDQGYVDPDRIGVFGHSYGGFMTLAALTQYPEVFDAGVDIYGVSDWYDLFANLPTWWTTFGRQTEVEMGDKNDESYWRKVSPLYHADNIVRPLMVIQGANDPRVKQFQSDQIVEAVRANGVPVEYLVFPDEGHGIEKKKNKILAYRKVLEFLEKHL